MPHSNKIGNLGESLAFRFLQSKGHLIIGQNVQVGHLEIDLITVKNQVIHYVEVKTSSIDFDTVLAQFTALKLKRIQQAAIKHFAHDPSLMGLAPSTYSIGLICIVVNKKFKKAQIQWFEDVYE